MVFRGLRSFREGHSAREEPLNTPDSLGYPSTLTKPATSSKTSSSHRSLAGSLAPPSKVSVLDQILKIILPRTSRTSKAKLKIAPSGAIVFTPVRSQESLVSSILPGKVCLSCLAKHMRADE